MLRFWDATGAPIGVIQYELRLHDLITARSPVVTVAMGLGLSGTGPHANDSSWQRATGPSPDHPGDSFATGLVVVSLGPATTAWYLTLGRVDSVHVQKGAVTFAEPLPHGSVVLSDLALAGDTAADNWQSGEDAVRLGRSSLFDRKVPVHIFYQTLSEASHGSVRTVITCTDVTDPAMGRRVLQVAFNGRLDRGVNASERELDMSHVKPGRYQVEVDVNAQGGGSSWQMTTFTLR
jgi:hypothetical protein